VAGEFENNDINHSSKNPIFSYELDKMDENPLYHQLVLIVRQSINSGALNINDELPSEAELCKFFGISRSTVRQAFAQLEKEGLVYRRRGLGTFVANLKLKKNVNSLYSFTTQTILAGMTPSSKVIKFSVIEADFELMQAFKVKGTNFKVNDIYRVRKADGVPLLLEHTYIPYSICPVLTAQRLEEDSLYSILTSECGVLPHHGYESYEVTQTDKKTSSLLECPVGTLAFAVERIASLENNEVYEVTRSIVRGDRLKYEVPLTNDIDSPYRKFK